VYSPTPTTVITNRKERPARIQVARRRSFLRMCPPKSDFKRLIHQDCHPERSEGSRSEILRYAQNDIPGRFCGKAYQCPEFWFRAQRRARAGCSTSGGQSMKTAAFFTDPTVCIGCKACEVACKEWNQLPAENGGVRELSGDSYDNTRKLDGIHWRHVRFIEQFKGPYDGRWLMMSDVCKHCVQAGCLE